MNKAPIITLMGPTASGKTAAAMALIQKYPLEIISVDSAMIYKHMDIGTSKPSKKEIDFAPHHLIDFLEPTESYSAAEFCEDALGCIKDIHSRNKIPFLVGGTMMYFHALIHGINELPEANTAIRKKLSEEKEAVGLAGLHQRLKNIDPKAAEKIHPNDPQRLLRALEVYEITGKPLSEFWRQKTTLVDEFSVTQLAIFPDNRGHLHKKIEKRFLQMLDKGFIDEVRDLKKNKALNLNCPSMRCVGYRQIWQYLEDKFDYEVMVEKALAATRQLAKRQLTWLRSWEGVQLFSSSEQLVAEFKI